jgi:phosphatidylinositol alpha 1,6-mannosyltransferase
MSLPRVALFADSFHEVNGAAHTCRQFEAFAQRTRQGFLTVRCGPAEFAHTEGPLWTLQFKRGPCSFTVDRDLHFDPTLFLRRRHILETLRQFRPDVVHITSPGELGILGAWAAHSLGVPFVASWHTNLHEFGAQRLGWLLGFLPRRLREPLTDATERWILERVLWFYGLAQATLAPNEEIVELIRGVSRKPVFPMGRGVDTTLFCPERRDRTSGPFRLGFVGRLTPEKNVRFLAQLEQGLVKSGVGPFRLVVVGDGGEKSWLATHVKRVLLTGVLTGPRLAREYANMDLFVFPSRTDTFGNVVLEAMASGVPAVVTDRGGAKFLLEDGVSGRVAATGEEFIQAVADLMSNCQMHHRMRLAARVRARQFTWDYVFEQQVRRAYEACMSGGARVDRTPQLGRLVAVEE